MSMQPCQIPAQLVVFKGITVKGFWLSKWLQQVNAEERAAVYGELTQLIASGELSVPIFKTFPVKDIKEALKLAVQGGRNGKILITP